MNDTPPQDDPDDDDAIGIIITFTPGSLFLLGMLAGSIVILVAVLLAKGA